VVSLGALHKSDIGGVRLGLQDVEAARIAMREMRVQLGSKIEIQGFLLEEMAPSGHEIVVGGQLHPQFGPVVMVGLGGVFVEVLDDIAFRLCPIDEDEARAMLAELRGAAILDGARGRAKASRDAIVDVLLRVGGPDGMLMQLGDEVAEVDINPLIVGPTEAAAVDARVILAHR
jgi:hypothetical protein